MCPVVITLLFPYRLIDDHTHARCERKKPVRQATDRGYKRVRVLRVGSGLHKMKLLCVGLALLVFVSHLANASIKSVDVTALEVQYAPGSGEFFSL